MDADPTWTLEELSARVAKAIAQLGLLQANGQVADAPNARAIRWYTSTGLVRRPQQKGRVAFYGVHHLRELVAIKRLQSQGLTLEQVQAELQGKNDDAIAALANIPTELERAEAPAPAPAPAPARSDFWVHDVPEAEVVAVPVEVVPAPVRVAIDHSSSGVTLVFPSTRTPTSDEAQAILSAVVEQLTARGLLAVSPEHPEHQENQ